MSVTQDYKSTCNTLDRKEASVVVDALLTRRDYLVNMLSFGMDVYWQEELAKVKAVLAKFGDFSK